MGAQLTPSLWGSHRNSEVSPQKKERKRRVEGHQGTPICPEASHFSRSGEGCVKSWGARAVPGWGSPRELLSASGNSPCSPRPLESSVPARLLFAVGDGVRASAAPSGESTRGRRQVPEPSLRLHREPKAKSWRPARGGTSPVPRPPGKRGRPGPGASPVPAVSPGARPAPPMITRARPARGGRRGRSGTGAGWWLQRGRPGHAGARRLRRPAAPGCACTPDRHARGCKGWGRGAGPRRAVPDRPGGAGGPRARCQHPRPRRRSRACRC